MTMVFDLALSTAPGVVHMSVDHPGKDGCAAEIDHSRIGGNRHRGPDVRNPVAPDQDDLVGQHRAGLGIEQTAGPDCHDVVRGRKERRPWLGLPLGQYDGSGNRGDRHNDARQPSGLGHEILQPKVG